MPSNSDIITADLLTRFSDICGADNVVQNGPDMARYLVEWRDNYYGKAAIILRPGTVADVSEIMKLAHETGTSIVPQGGNTGLVGGQIPSQDGNEIVLSLERLNTIRNIDAKRNLVTVDAGVTLLNVQQAAESENRLFPLSLASQGSCTIGGNLATNAGGIGVIAYGNARALCLGLEVVMADGRVWSHLKGLAKDNTGYDLQNLFIGSEGTLGIITGAVLRLYPRTADVSTALIGISEVEAAVELLALAGELSGNAVTAIELIPYIGIEFVTRHCNAHIPLSDNYNWYVLLELSGAGPAGRLDEIMTNIFQTAAEAGLVQDGVIAASQTQNQRLWELREKLSEAQKFEGGSIKHDVSLPIDKVAEFITHANQLVTKMIPDCRPVPFGHIGDGNIHYNINQPIGADREEFLARTPQINMAVYELVLELGGSISAEHGIGQVKRDLMTKIKNPEELAMMRGIKAMLDPKCILNPGKMLPE